MSPEQLFADLLARQPGRPFVTYYDESSGERSELSAKSAANWVAKTYHLLDGELGLGVGDTAQFALPAHWISVPIMLGCLCAGLALSPAAEDAAVAFVTESTVTAAGRADDVFAIDTSSAAIGFGAQPPHGSADYVAAVRPQPDAWATVAFAATDTDPCLPGSSRADVVRDAIRRAAELGLGSGARLLVARGWHDPQDWVDTVFAPLAVSGSIVILDNCPDQHILERRAAQERVTNRL